MYPIGAHSPISGMYKVKLFKEIFLALLIFTAACKKEEEITVTVTTDELIENGDS